MLFEMCDKDGNGKVRLEDVKVRLQPRPQPRARITVPSRWSSPRPQEAVKKLGEQGRITKEGRIVTNAEAASHA